MKLSESQLQTLDDFIMEIVHDLNYKEGDKDFSKQISYTRDKVKILASQLIDETLGEGDISEINHLIYSGVVDVILKAKYLDSKKEYLLTEKKRFVSRQYIRKALLKVQVPNSNDFEFLESTFNPSSIWLFHHCSLILEKVLDKTLAEEWIGDLEEVLHKMHKRRKPKLQLNFEVLRRTFYLLKSVPNMKMNSFLYKKKSTKR